MLVKILGSLILFAASCAISRIIYYNRRQTIKTYRELILLVEYIKRNISSYRTPVGVILRGYHSEYFDRTDFGDTLRNIGLSTAFEKCSLPISKEALEILTDFAVKLGSDYADNEIKRCDECLAHLTYCENKASESLEKNRDLYRFIPPLGAVSVIIMLI